MSKVSARNGSKSSALKTKWFFPMVVLLVATDRSETRTRRRRNPLISRRRSLPSGGTDVARDNRIQDAPTRPGSGTVARPVHGVLPRARRARGLGGVFPRRHLPGARQRQRRLP